MEAAHLKFITDHVGADQVQQWENFFYNTLFSISDTIGRYAAGIECMILSRKKTLALNYGRTLFLATFLLVGF